MDKEPVEHGTIVVLPEGTELLHVVRSSQGQVRVAVYREKRGDGFYHWYDLEFLEDDGWDLIFRIGDRKLQEAIDMFAAARDFVKNNPPPAHE